MCIRDSIQTFNAQRYGEINDKLQKLSEKRTWDKGIINDDLVGKKFVTVKSEGAIVIKRILQFEENNKITMIELIEDKKTDNNTDVYKRQTTFQLKKHYHLSRAIKEYFCTEVHVRPIS